MLEGKAEQKDKKELTKKIVTDKLKRDNLEGEKVIKESQKEEARECFGNVREKFSGIIRK